MAVGIGKSCCDRDKACPTASVSVHKGAMTDRWHPGLRLLVIVGGSATLWAVLLSAIA